MRVLVLESDPRAATVAGQAVEAAGHEVVRCFAPGVGAFPCRALEVGAMCPVDEGVDVALLVRSRPWPKPTALERGGICALRARVPLVVAGHHGLDPWVAWASASIDGSEGVVDVCTAVVAAGS